ncbi:MAG: hypothetical protein NDJ90_09895 [Oligoflexia bacterium]|nr:hypothetical protein [Oligoflexia bacterium]
MALVWIDGFEDGVGATVQTAVSENTAYWTAAITVTTTARTSSPTVTAQSLSGGNTLMVPAQTELIIGSGLYFSSSNAVTLFEFRNTAGNGIRIRRLADNKIEVVRISDSVNLGTSTATLTVNVWNYIEVRVKIHATAGEVVVRLDETECLNLTGLNTTAGSVSDIDRISTFNSNVYDDFYVCDTTGAQNNSFLGAIHVYTLMPNAVGSSTQFTPTGAANNWDAVNEAGADTGTHVSSNSPGNIDSYNIETFTGTPTAIPGVMLSAFALKTDTKPRSFKLRCKVGANVTSSSAFTLNSAYRQARIALDTQPSGAAWTKSDIDSMEAGIEVV